MNDLMRLLLCSLLGLGWGTLSPGGLLHGQLADATITTIEGTTQQGTIESIDAEGAVKGSGLPAGLKLSSLLSIATTPAAPASDATVWLHTAGGGRVGGSSATLSDEKVRLTTPTGPLDVPLQAVTALVWSSSPLVKQTLENPPRDEDRIIVRVNDQEQAVDGLLESITEEALSINYQGQSRDISLDKIQAVVVADLGLTPAKGTQVELLTQAGGIWRGALVSLQNNQLRLGLSREDTITLPVESVATIKIASDRLQFLSDIDPVDVRQSVQFTVERAFQKDRSIAGNALRIRGTESGSELRFEKGLGTQASCELVFANSDAFDRLRATVGIDLETGGRGHCDVVVRGDGIELWKRRLTADMPPVELDVDVSGLDRISLVVQPGPEFDLADHVDWGNARFLKLN